MFAFIALSHIKVKSTQRIADQTYKERDFDKDPESISLSKLKWL